MTAETAFPKFCSTRYSPCPCITGLLNNLSHDMLGEMGHMVVSALVGLGFFIIESNIWDGRYLPCHLYHCP